VATDFILPELGEQIAGGDVLRVMVAVGDTLAHDQPVLELETDKATIEVPSSVSGLVTQVRVKVGDKVKVGQVVLSVDGAAGAPPSQPGVQPAAAPPVDPRGPVDASSGREPQAEPASTGAGGPPTQVGGGSPHVDKVVDFGRGSRPPSDVPNPDTPPAPAAPSVRRLARELGVDINTVSGTESGGRISIEDVKSHAKGLLAALGQGGGLAAGGAAALPDFSRWGGVERQPMRAVRRKTAEHLSAAWTTIPHVTQCDLADITALDALRRTHAASVTTAGGSLTVTSIALKVVAAALKRFPQFNASIDMRADEIILKQYVNIGVAVDTDRGLLVPVIRDADRKNILQLSVELTALSEKARSRKIAPEEMQGGCFSISNLGGIGGTYFTPIVNAPEVAILGMSRARMEPVYDKESGQFVPRLMLPLSLSYDHRAIDGADGIRFLRWVVEALEQPFLLALQG
jgi:pyruvate dehydrogenase E2 component (dihydrolipoamide acetyltransferase)